MSDLLTQEELNALLSGIDDFDAANELELDGIGDAVSSEQIRNYDFSRREKIIRGHMPFLDNVAENFAGLLRRSLTVFIGQSIEIERYGIQVQHFFEYTQSWPQHTLFAIARFAPLRGRVVVAVEPNLVFSVIDHYFGGHSSSHRQDQNQSISPAMMRVVELFLALVFNDLEKAWKPVMAVGIDYSPAVSAPDFANVAGPDEVIVMSTMRIQFKGGEGNLNVAMPYSMVEPVKDILSGQASENPEDDKLWQEAFCRQLLCAEVSVTSHMSEKQITLREVMSWKEGDVIVIAKPEEAMLKVQGMPLYTGKSGLSGGRKALRVTGRTDHYTGLRLKKRVKSD